jgi:hypothetical protein
MTAWMDFIGKSYYTVDKFIAEAKKYGVTRRIGANMIARMAWGDMVACLQRTGGRKSYSVVLEYPITKIVGVSEAARAIMADEPESQMEQLDDEPEQVYRECGSYETTGTYAIDAPLGLVAKRLLQLSREGIDVGKLMIGCLPHDIQLIEQPYPKLGGFTQSRGFRPYNRERFWADVEEARQTGRKQPLRGTYYLAPQDSSERYGFLETVKDYIRKEDMEKEEKLIGQMSLL